MGRSPVAAFRFHPEEPSAPSISIMDITNVGPSPRFLSSVIHRQSTGPRPRYMTIISLVAVVCIFLIVTIAVGAMKQPVHYPVQKNGDSWQMCWNIQWKKKGHEERFMEENGI